MRVAPHSRLAIDGRSIRVVTSAEGPLFVITVYPIEPGA